MGCTIDPRIIYRISLHPEAEVVHNYLGRGGFGVVKFGFIRKKSYPSDSDEWRAVEWRAADVFFKKNPGATKFRRKRQELGTNVVSERLGHSFIRDLATNTVFKLANKDGRSRGPGEDEVAVKIQQHGDDVMIARETFIIISQGYFRGAMWRKTDSPKRREIVNGKPGPSKSSDCKSYIVMERFDKSLRKKIDGNQFTTPKEKLIEAWRLQKALDEFHSLRRSHGDVKPGNLLQARNKSYMLTDGAFAMELPEPGEIMVYWEHKKEFVSRGTSTYSLFKIHSGKPRETKDYESYLNGNIDIDAQAMKDVDQFALIVTLSELGVELDNDLCPIFPTGSWTTRLDAADNESKRAEFLARVKKNSSSGQNGCASFQQIFATEALKLVLEEHELCTDDHLQLAKKCPNLFFTASPTRSDLVQNLARVRQLQVDIKQADNSAEVWGANLTSEGSALLLSILSQLCERSCSFNISCYEIIKPTARLLSDILKPATPKEGCRRKELCGKFDKFLSDPPATNPIVIAVLYEVLNNGQSHLNVQRSLRGKCAKQFLFSNLKTECMDHLLTQLQNHYQDEGSIASDVDFQTKRSLAALGFFNPGRTCRKLLGRWSQHRVETPRVDADSVPCAAEHPSTL